MRTGGVSSRAGGDSSSTRASSKPTPSTSFNSALNRASTGPKPRRRVPLSSLRTGWTRKAWKSRLSIVWNIEFDQQLGESLLLRVNYRENRARDRLVIDRVTDSAGSALVLSSTGRLTGREFDATIRWTLANRGDLFVSFSKIRTKGNREEPRGIETNSLDLFEAVMEKPRNRYAPFVTRAAYNFGLHSVREMEAAHAGVSV